MKGIIIKETPYKDNDKILTILTDKLGKISCIGKGSKKSNSPILACSQYLVYSEILLYRSNNFYYINSADVISTFYDFRIDFDKLEIAFELTRLINIAVGENEDTSDILRLFLNTIYMIQENKKDVSLLKSIFKIKLFAILGFAPNTNNCIKCGQVIKTDFSYFDYVSNSFICDKCYNIENKNRYIKLKYSTILAIRYICASNIEKIFSFNVTDIKNLEIFANTYQDILTNDI